jgi:hypothetical protein
VKFKSGLTIGIAVGYVLGARAGRERYEQIKRGAGAAREHPAVAQLGAQASGLTDLVRTGLAGGLEAGSRGLRVAVEQNTEPQLREVNASRN